MITKDRIMAFISKRTISFIASIDSDGFPNVKAMLAPRKIDGNNIYFSTNTSSLRVNQFKSNPKASVYFYEKGRFGYKGVMLLGNMEVHSEQNLKNEIWRDGDTMFYKEGIGDPDYCVLKFFANKARYYSSLKTETIDL